jgi:hypothetical protein
MIKRAFFIILCLFIAGCNTGNATPDPDGPILSGFDALPKALATVAFSPTPDSTQAFATLINRKPTETLPPPTLTASPTPYLGVFMGEPTFSSNNIIVVGTRPPAFQTLPPGPGTRAVVDVQPVDNSGTVPNNTGDNGTVAGNCTVQPAAPFANAARNPSVVARIGCPTGDAFAVHLVVQPFENGFMFWRDTKEIYILSTAALRGGAATDTFWRMVDSWNESIPADDPAIVPPAGLLQPVRGFGNIWRNNPTIRNGLGWALSAEQPYDSTWQNFEHGWMMSNNNGTVLALIPSDGPPPTTGIHFGPLS